MHIPLLVPRVSAHLGVSGHPSIFDDPMFRMYIYTLYVQTVSLSKHPTLIFRPWIPSIHGCLLRTLRQICLSCTAGIIRLWGSWRWMKHYQLYLNPIIHCKLLVAVSWEFMKCAWLTRSTFQHLCVFLSLCLFFVFLVHVCFESTKVDTCP